MPLLKLKSLCPWLIALGVCLCFIVTQTQPAYAAKAPQIKKPRINNVKDKQAFIKSKKVIVGVPGPTVSGRPYVPIEEALGDKDSALLAAPDGRRLYAKNIDMGLVPASAIKVLTVANAIYYLGIDYRFRTEVYLTPGNSLKIKGCGDPMLTSEVVRELAAELVNLLPHTQFKNLELDDTFFADGTFIVDGVEPNLHKLYNAANGALSVNFNAVSFTTAKDGQITNRDPHTPMVPMALAKAKATGKKSGTFVLWHENFEPTMYAGEIFKHFLEEYGVEFSGDLVRKAVDPSDYLLLEFYSPHTLGDVSRSLLRYSNNFIANQIIMTVAAEITGSPATMQTGLTLTQEYLSNNLNLGNVKLAEASGLSRQNKICAADMLCILENFTGIKDLLRSEKGHLYKTGTLKGVRSRVGYIESPNGSYTFVIMMNTPGSDVFAVLDNFFEMVKKDSGAADDDLTITADLN